MSVGSRILLLYIFLTYVPQSIASLVWTEAYAQEYLGYDRELTSTLLLMALVALIVFLLQHFIAKSTPLSFRMRTPLKIRSQELQWTRMFVVFSYVCLSVPFAIKYGFSFFHSGLYISELPTWVTLFQAMKSLSRLDLAYCLIRAMRGDRLSRFDLAATAAYTTGGIISFVGALDVIFLLLSGSLLIRRGEFIEAALSARRGKLWKKCLIAGLVIASLPLIAFMGFANKIGFERTYELTRDPDIVIEGFALPLMLRASSSHGSFVANRDLVLDPVQQASNMRYPLSNMTWRLCTLTRLVDCEGRADITHLARFNFTQTFQDQTPLKAGATPGLLASVVYFPLLPVALCAAALYCALFCQALTSALAYRKPNALGLLALLLVLYPALEDPIDILVVFDPAPIYTVSLLFLLRAMSKRISNPQWNSIAGDKTVGMCTP